MHVHLSSLGLGKKPGEDEIPSEMDLILNRAGCLDVDHEMMEQMTVCPKHRSMFSTLWQGRKINTCTYPTHNGQRRKIPSPRRVNSKISSEIYRMKRMNEWNE